MNMSQYDVCTLPVLLIFLTAVILLPVVAVHRKLHGKNGCVAGSEKWSTVFRWFIPLVCDHNITMISGG